MSTSPPYRQVANRRLDLVSELREAWSADTASGDWSPDNPAQGQCAVTALVIQDRLGGTLLRAVVNGVSHYWNRLPDDTELDLTREQFTEPLSISDVSERTREYVLSFPATVERYERLRGRL